MEVKLRDNKNYNLGIEFLRMILSFWVLVHHCGIIKTKIIKQIFFINPFHVPTFVIISFYFLYKTIIFRNITKIKQRLERLLIPYLIWPIIIYIINNSLNIFFNLYYKYSLIELVSQLLIGRSFQFILWYHFNIIFITILLTIICFIFHKNFLFVLLFLSVLSYFLQYSYLNYKFFINYSINISLSVGLIPEIFPIAVTGILVASIDFIKTLKKFKYKSILLSIITLIIIRKYDIFYNIKGIYYQGIRQTISALLLFFIFLLFSLDNIKYKAIFKQITSYTGGIYYLHIILPKYMYKIKLIRYRTVLGCIINYLTGYLICFIGISIFKKTKLKYLFY